MKKLLQKMQDFIDKIRGKNKPSSNITWKDNLSTFNVANNNFKFKTKDLIRPTGDGKNRDGGMEWIIARIEGEGYSRLLIMIMGGNRPPSRIYFQTGDAANETNSIFPIPMTQEADWEVEAGNGSIAIKLNNNVIWLRSGNFTINSVTMNGYVNRFSTGKWAV